MPRCIECHENYSDQLRRCPYCGASPDESPIGGGKAPTPKLWPEELRLRRKRMAIVGLAVAALLSVVGFVLWPSGDDPAAVPTTPTETARLKRPPRRVTESRIDAKPADHMLAVTELRRFRGGLTVTGTCSPHGAVRIHVNGKVASLFPEGDGFFVHLETMPTTLELDAINLESKRVKKTIPLENVVGDELAPRGRLWSHADGVTVHLGKVRVRAGTNAKDAKAVEVELPRVANEIRLNDAEFTLYRAPLGLAFLRRTRQGYFCFLRDRDGQEVILVPGGLGRRGAGQKPPNGPAHLVELSPFLIDRTEVTCAQYSRFLRLNNGAGDVSLRHVDDRGAPLRPLHWKSDAAPVGKEKDPVTGVCWFAAYAYAKWAGGDLPTEAQWERAAAGPIARKYAWGDRWAPENARFRSPSPVASHTMDRGRSWFDLLNTTGNAREWCRDRFDPRYYMFATRIDPLGPANANHRVVRGGSFLSSESGMVLQQRDHLEPVQAHPDVGFRVAMRWNVR